jgi:NAD(P)H-dependent flavin oxidoreductase YrpB (nitropropane dioxygenase family)
MSKSTTDPVIDSGYQRAASALPDVPALETRLTREYGIRHPFVRAGMGFIAHERLAAAVTNAGGLGALGAYPDPADSVPVMVEQSRALTSGPFGSTSFAPKQDSGRPAQTGISMCASS